MFALHCLTKAEELAGTSQSANVTLETTSFAAKT